MAEPTAQPDTSEYNQPDGLDELYNLSDEDFLKQYNEAQAQAAAQSGGQPRDEQGRFVSKQESEPPVQETPETQTEQIPTQFVREIDLGEGAGVEVFKADTLEELVDKIAEAKRNASLKIRELSQAQKAQPRVEEPTAAALNPDEEWLVGQELLTTPTKAFAKLFKLNTGMTIEQFKATQKTAAEIAQDRREQQSAMAFVQSHPEYVPNKYNSELIENYLRSFNQEGTVENIERAFNTLSAGGLLNLKGKETQATTETQSATSEQGRIAPTPGTRTVVVQRKAASGLSAKTSVEAPKEHTTQDLYDMPYEEFLKLGGQSSQDNW